MSLYWNQTPAILAHVYAEPLGGAQLLGFLSAIDAHTDNRSHSPTAGWTFLSRERLKAKLHLGAAAISRLDLIGTAFGLLEVRQHAGARRGRRHAQTLRRTLVPLDRDALAEHLDQGLLPIIPPGTTMHARLELQAMAAHLQAALRATPLHLATRAQRQAKPATPLPLNTAPQPPAPALTTVEPVASPVAPVQPVAAPVPVEPAPAVPAGTVPTTAAVPARTDSGPSQDVTNGPSRDRKESNGIRQTNPNHPAAPITAPGGGGETLSLLGQVRALGQQLGVGAGALYAALSRGLPGTDLAPVLTALPATLDPGWRQRARDPLAYLVHLARNVVRAREVEAALAQLPPEAPPPAAPVGECAAPPDADAPAPPPPGCAADRWASFLTALLARLGLAHTPAIFALMPWEVDGAGELRPVPGNAFAERYLTGHTELVATIAETWRTAA